MMVVAMSTQSISMSANAKPPRFHAKNNQPQSILGMSWIINKVSGLRCLLNPPSRQISHAAIAISAKRVLQTELKSHSGGASLP